MSREKKTEALTAEEMAALVGGNPTADEREFIVPSSDTHGQSSTIQFRASPGWVRRVQVLFESRKFPYSTVSELHRHALARHVKYLEEMGGFPSTSKHIELMDAVIKDEQMSRKFETLVNHLAKIVQEYRAKGDIAGAKVLIQSAWNTVKDSPDTPWMKSFVRQFRSQFGDLMAPEPVSLLEFGDDGTAEHK